MKKLWKRVAFIVTFVFTFNVVWADENAPAPCLPVPSENQINWQEMEFYAFIHLSTNTFTNQEWGFGTAADAQLFNPDSLDCNQWARICKEAGMKGIILTAKHHSGFCLWPTETTDYSVKNSPWKNGKGDIMRDLAEACKKYGLKLGVYISPWDRNHASYGLLDPDGTAPYVKNVFRKQIEECLTNYGDIFEIWFDGANGGNGYYGGAKTTRKIDRKTYYDWPETYNLIRKLQPNCVIWSDNADRADLRWVGTEAGYVGETNWSLLYKTGDVPEKMLCHGVENGDTWVPGEVNTSIRPGWFYHSYEDTQVKKVTELMDTYYKSIGRNGTFLLNFPIDQRGMIHENDEKEIVAFAKAMKEAFANNLAKKAKITASNVRGKRFSASNVTDGNKDTYWTTNDTIKTAAFTLDFGKPTSMNRFLVQENIRLGQRVKSFKLEALIQGKWELLHDKLTSGENTMTTIGYKRIICFQTIKASKLRFTITDAKACPVISNIEVYNAPQILLPPVYTREKSGDIVVTPVDKKWTIVNSADLAAIQAIDGKTTTTWLQNSTMPVDLVLDLGKTEDLVGFKYLPSQSGNSGIITHYQLFTSIDNKNWKLTSEGEFSNIRNNPIWQTIHFPAENVRYVKFRALKNTLDNNAAGYAELEVITK